MSQTADFTHGPTVELSPPPANMGATRRRASRSGSHVHDSRVPHAGAHPIETPCPSCVRLTELLKFESLLAELSATFVNLAADQVDAQIQAALQRLVELLQVDRGGLAEVQTNQKRTVITHSYNRPGVPSLPPFVLDEQLPWYAKTIHQGEAVKWSALPDDLPVEATHERAYCTSSGLKSHVMIPLKVTGTIMGAIGFGSFHRQVEWPDELVQRLHMVGDIFTNAIARRSAEDVLRAREQSLQQTQLGLRELAAKLISAQEEERRRIAREMHDDWTQRLAVLAIETTKFERELKLSPPGRSSLQVIREGLVSLSEDVHDLSRQLHPSILDDLGLAEALRSECTGFARRERIAIDYRHDEVPISLARDAAMCIYRITQEALRNVGRHAAVDTASVSLTVSGAHLVLRVADQGAGFDPARTRSQAGLGLSSMEERVRLVGAELSITSAPGLGTTVAVRVPLNQGAS